MRAALTVPSEAPALYFASGSHHPGEIRGFAAVGQPVGVAAPECRGSCEAELKRLAGSGIPVFVDSGAFSEVEFPKGQPPRVAKPISDSEWRKRLDFYHRLAEALGSQLYAVAPDMVGNQAETLKRLRRYRGDVQRLRASGAHILVPLQGGRMPLTEFDRKAQEALGFSDYTVALPMKKGATSLETIRRFLSKRCPPEIHLLGLGEKSKLAPEVTALIRELCPMTSISMDSNRLKAYVGWRYKDYVKRMKRAGVKPIPEAEWKPTEQLLLPGYRTMPEVEPREFTLAREFVGPVRPRFGLELAHADPRKLGLERWGIRVWTDKELLDRLDEWLPMEARREMMRQRELDDAWLDVPFGGPVPPEAPFVDAQDIPLPDDDPEVTQEALGLTPKQAVDLWLRSPREYLTRNWGRGRTWTPSEYSWEAGPLRFRPFYLDYLGAQRMNGTTLAAAWRKQRSVEATFGRGRLRREFEQWKKNGRRVTTQPEYEMQLAMLYELDPGAVLGRRDWEVVKRGMSYPQYDEYVLRHWGAVSPERHVERERQRAVRLLEDRRAWRDDPYYEWGSELTPADSGLLRRVAQMRVAQRKGEPHEEISGVPKRARASRVRGYRSPKMMPIERGQRVANRMKRKLLIWR